MIRLIRVLCTGRGRHRAYALRPVQVDDETGAWKLASKGPIPMTAGPDEQTSTWRWQCPRCGRDTQISDERHQDFWLKLAATGVSELDISLLPF